MSLLSFSDGFLTLFLIQLLILGLVLIFDGSKQNQFLGAFVFVYALNSSRVVLFSLVSEVPFINFYVGFSWAAFFFPLLFLYLKSHVKDISRKEIVKHSVFPTLYLLYLGIFRAFTDYFSSDIISYTQFASYTVLSLMALFYFFNSYKLKRRNKLWSKIIKNIRNRVYYFVIGILIYLFLISSKILISLIFEIDYSPDGIINIIESTLFYLVFTFIPVYAYTVIFRFKKFIQPKNIIVKSALRSNEIEKKLQILFANDKIHKEPELNSNTLCSILDIPIKDLRIYIKNNHNKSINEYINEQRIKEFLSLASTNKSSLYNIEGMALDSGFNSRATFYRVFKKIYGETPLEYMNKEKFQ